MSPFIESRYREMMDGLDAREVHLSEIAGPALLLSPDFHSGERARALKKMSASLRVDDCFSTVAQTVARIDSPVIEYDLTDAFSHFLEKDDRVGEIKSAKKTANPGDLVVSRLRSYLREMAVVPRRPAPQLFSSEFVVLRPKAGSAVSAQTLQALLLGAAPQAILARSQYGTGHPRFHEFALTEMPIPAAVVAMNGALTETIKAAEKSHEKARTLYMRAESRLLESIGMTDWRPDGRGWTVKNLSETLEAHDRLDAEYYLPMYDDLFALLRRVGCAPLGSLAEIRKSIEPGSAAYRAAGIPFLRVADFSRFGFSAPSKFLDADEYGALASSLGPRADSVLLTKDGTPGVAYRAEENMRAITSGAILHLTMRAGSGVSADYLALALNSLPVRTQAARDMGGTVIRHWRPDQIGAALIPLPPEKHRRALAGLARESFRLRGESRRLLAAAVRAAECAVEKGERAGMDILADG